MTEADEAPYAAAFDDSPDAEPVRRSLAAPPPRSRLRRMLDRRVIAAIIVVAILATGGGIAYARRSTDTVSYRTAQPTLGTVTQTLALSGNLAPFGETDLDFGSSGRVASVSVKPGDKVTAGQTLATLDATTLQGALTQAQANLASAQAKLSLDQAGPTAQSLANPQASVSSAQVGLHNAQTALTDTQQLNQVTLTQAQDAVTNLQNTVNADQANVGADQQKAQADQANPAAYAADQQKLAADNAALAKDSAALASAQSSLQMTTVKVQQSNDQAQSQVATGQVQLTNAQAALAALQQGVASQTITQDQSGVSVAQVNVANAQRAVDQATLAATVAGTIGQVNITVGQAVTGNNGSGSGASSAAVANSTTTHHITILAPGAFQVAGSVSDTQVNLVAIGQRVRVTPAGSSQAVTGKVTQVDSVATVTSGVATFGVLVALDGLNPSLHAGVSASIQIIVNQVVGVLTVPTSAVQNGAIQVMVNGVPQTRQVTVGASDPLRTEISSGLSQTDTVVIATVSSAVPTTSAGGAGGGIFGAGGAGGAGGRGAGGGAGGVRVPAGG